MRHFETPAEALAYVMPELLDTLRDDLETQEGSEREHYTDEDRQTMRDRIADLEEIAPSVVLRPVHDKTRAALGQLLEQVYQMQGMFSDDDGAIQRAVDDAEKALEAVK